jgi:hypothetical protein
MNWSYLLDLDLFLCTSGRCERVCQQVQAQPIKEVEGL